MKTNTTKKKIDLRLVMGVIILCQVSTTLLFITKDPTRLAFYKQMIKKYLQVKCINVILFALDICIHVDFYYFILERKKKKALWIESFIRLVSFKIIIFCLLNIRF